MKKLILLSTALVGLLVCSITIVYAQGVGINQTGTPPDPSAGLDVNFTNKGTLITRMTTAQRDAISNPAEGLQIFNITTRCLEIYISPIWQSTYCGCNAPAATIAGVHNPSKTQIVWNWSTVSGATGYKYNTVNNYSTATDNSTSTTYTQTGLICNTSYTLYVWAYSNCGNSSSTALIQITSSCCGFTSCGLPLVDCRDGQSYNTIQIGSQCWMAQNLNYGTQISQSSAQTSNQKWCYNDDNTNCTSYGGLYQWSDVTGQVAGSAGVNCNPCGPTTGFGGVQGMCPSGWHVPSHYEWTTLEQTVCAQNPAGPNCAGSFPYNLTTTGWLATNEGTKMKSATGNPWGDGTYSTNTSGFTALPTGQIYNGSSIQLGSYTGFWTATGYNATYAWYRLMVSNTSELLIDNGQNYTNNQAHGYSMRCVKD